MRKGKRFPWGQVIGVGLSVAMGVGCGVVMTSWFDRCPAGVSRPLWALGLAAAFLLALLAQITLHEGGHLVCGLRSGYRFCSFRVGSLMWMRAEDGHLRLRRLRLAGTGGQCLMAPPDMVDGRLPVTLYNFGGALANLLTVALSLALYGPARRVPLLAAFLLFLAVIGGFSAAMNGIPLRLNGITNDGRNALSLQKDPAALRAFWVQMRVAAAQAQGLEQAGKSVPLEELQPGDLIYFSYVHNGRYKNISHVAIYAGNGMIIEAANESTGVVYRKLHSRGSIVTVCRP